MSHVDEGALHAYLDGALEEYPTGDARRIRAHLERCETCARALDEARRVRDEADLLLAMPSLDISAPPLEELKRLARSAPADAEVSPRRLPLYRVGWAASVLLALGVGWMLRSGVSVSVDPVVAEGARSRAADPVVSEGQPSDAPATAVAAVAEPAEREVDSGDVGDIPVDEPQARIVAEEVRVAAAEPAEPIAPDLSEEVLSSEQMAYAELPTPADRGQADVVLEDALGAQQLKAQDAATENLAMEAEAPTVDASVEEAERIDVARDDVMTSGQRVALAARSTGEVASGLQISGLPGSDRPTERRASEERSEPGSLVIPGLEVVSIVWREEGVVPAGVRVLQRLESGGLLELVHLPAGFDPDAVEPAEPGVRELVIPRDQGWLILRARLADEEFLTLLERMDAPEPD